MNRLDGFCFGTTSAGVVALRARHRLQTLQFHYLDAPASSSDETTCSCIDRRPRRNGAGLLAPATGMPLSASALVLAPSCELVLRLEGNR